MDRLEWVRSTTKASPDQVKMSAHRCESASPMVKAFESSRANRSPIASRFPGATTALVGDAFEVVVTLLDVGPEAVPALAALLSDTERERASRFAFDRDRRRFIVSRAGLRELLATRLGVWADLALDPRAKPLGFFNCWTRKEAFIKTLGDRFDVSLAPGGPARILRVENTPGNECAWCRGNFSPAAGFVAAVVIENPKHYNGLRAYAPQSAQVAEAQ